MKIAVYAIAKLAHDSASVFKRARYISAASISGLRASCIAVLRAPVLTGAKRAPNISGVARSGIARCRTQTVSGRPGSGQLRMRRMAQREMHERFGLSH